MAELSPLERESRNVAEGKHAELKEKAKEELRLLLLITAYLGILFWAFLTYRRLISREMGVTSFHYGFAVIEAIVIAKVILIGKAIGLGKGGVGAGRALALPVLRASFLYALLIAAFAVLEHIVEGMIHRKNLVQSLAEIGDKGIDEILARAVVLFVTLIPFFAIWKLDEHLGERRLFEIFFGKRSAKGPR